MPWLSHLILPKMVIVAIFLKIGILILSFNYRISGAIFINIGILILSFEISEFWCYFYNHWNSNLILSNIGILALFSLVCVYSKVGARAP